MYRNRGGSASVAVALVFVAAIVAAGPLTTGVVATGGPTSAEPGTDVDGAIGHADENETVAAADRSEEVLRVASKPDGADVYVDGEHVGNTPFEGEIAADDPIDVRVEHDEHGSRTYEDVALPETIKVDFEAEGEPVTIDSDPDGATVIVDGEAVGETPWSEEFPPGETVDVVLQKEDYENRTLSDVNGGDEIDVELDPIEQPLEIDSIDAPSHVDAAERDAIDVTATVRNDGEADREETLAYVFDGRVEERRQVRVGPGETETVSFALSDLDRFDSGAYEHGVESSDDDRLLEVEIDADEEPAIDVDAGNDLVVEAGSAVSLDGSDSTLPDGDRSIAWEQRDGPTVAIEDDDALTATVTAPDVESSTTLEFRFEVTDDEGNEGSDTIAVTVEPTDGETDDGDDSPDGDQGGDGDESGDGDGSEDEDPDDENEGDDESDGDDSNGGSDADDEDGDDPDDGSGGDADEDEDRSNDDGDSDADEDEDRSNDDGDSDADGSEEDGDGSSSDPGDGSEEDQDGDGGDGSDEDDGDEEDEDDRGDENGEDDGGDENDEADDDEDSDSDDETETETQALIETDGSTENQPFITPRLALLLAVTAGIGAVKRR